MNEADQSAAAFARGVELFNRGAFFEAHEELEDAWRVTHGEARLLLQALTQAAVALHHHSTGNQRGALSVMARSLQNMAGYPEVYGGIELDRFRRELRSFHDRLLEGTSPAAVPRIFLKPGDLPATRC